MVPFFKIQNMEIFKKARRIFITTLLMITIGCNSQHERGNAAQSSDIKDIRDKVTFIELGSVRCIPCQQMQPIMKSIVDKYSNQVQVVFHDVWTEAGAPFAKQYNIEAIPTQVFLDKEGKEYFRHVGFFPEEELVKVLQLKGVK